MMNITTSWWGWVGSVSVEDNISNGEEGDEDKKSEKLWRWPWNDAI